VKNAFALLCQQYPVFISGRILVMAPLFALCSVGVLLGLQTVTATSVDNKTYEYIVVGSGPGGGPIASNLARAGHSVLLLEAGCVISI
jgi:NADPH-dependent 2,4-dienoyl-CoA reductase/sulfur reductase-like enzyme